MAALFTDVARLARWLEIELLATEAWAALGVVPAADAGRLPGRGRRPSTRRSSPPADERERVTDHDVAAFVDVVQAAIGGAGGQWIHYGLTSSDVVDTALVLDAARRRRPAGRGGRRAGRHARRRAPASTATPPWSGAPTASTPSRPPSAPSWRCGASRPTATAPGCARARAAVAVGKLSGAVGTYSNVDPAVERHVCAALGPDARAGHPGDRPRPPRRVPVRRARRSGPPSS